MSRWFVYILRCRNGSLYTGLTNDLEKRVNKHNAGTGAKYTRAFRPVNLVYFEELKTAQQARKREAAIKKLRKADKEVLILTA
ncbi:MAG: GIY-YIG nuclease family protein [Patescibacteria group bacterium]